MKIRCHRQHLSQRCAERGYSLEEVMPCVVERDGEIWLVDVDHPAYPRPRGLGDRVELALKSVGITPEKVSKITGKPCNCGKRKEWLNRLGERFGVGKPMNK